MHHARSSLVILALSFFGCHGSPQQPGQGGGGSSNTGSTISTGGVGGTGSTCDFDAGVGTGSAQTPVGRGLEKCNLEHKVQDDTLECQRLACYSTATTGTDFDKCDASYQKDVDVSKQQYIGCIKDALTANGDALACVASVDAYSKTHDADGDGLGDFWEVHMVDRDPCNKSTVSGMNDGAADQDGDGVPDSQDDNPLCNPSQPTSGCF